MELTIDTQARPERVLSVLAEAGILVDQARADGRPLDVTPYRERAAELRVGRGFGKTAAALGSVDPEAAAVLDDPRPIPGVDLTERAGEIALAAGLTAADFAGRSPSGKTGFTVADVQALIAERVGG